MPRAKKAYFRVVMDVPDGADLDDVEECLTSHLAAMGGDRRPPGGYGDNDPGDPMFGLDREALTVERLKH